MDVVQSANGNKVGHSEVGEEVGSEKGKEVEISPEEVVVGRVVEQSSVLLKTPSPRRGIVDSEGFTLVVSRKQKVWVGSGSNSLGKQSNPSQSMNRIARVVGIPPPPPPKGRGEREETG
ncbi:unnamed protein product [Linum trigynum]|uniref:Uncharacterized protein n=1 Tax=Linum trigynum TaxID=586398 RepID=A0AAV2GPD5_9ROSI